MSHVTFMQCINIYQYTEVKFVRIALVFNNAIKLIRGRSVLTLIEEEMCKLKATDLGHRRKGFAPMLALCQTTRIIRKRRAYVSLASFTTSLLDHD